MRAQTDRLVSSAGSRPAPAARQQRAPAAAAAGGGADRGTQRAMEAASAISMQRQAAAQSSTIPISTPSRPVLQRPVASASSMTYQGSGGGRAAPGRAGAAAASASAAATAAAIFGPPQKAPAASAPSKSSAAVLAISEGRTGFQSPARPQPFQRPSEAAASPPPVEEDGMFR